MAPNESATLTPVTPAAQLLHAVAREALAACDPRDAVARAVHAGHEEIGIVGRSLTLKKPGRLVLIAYGKAAEAMTRGFLDRALAAGGKRTIQGFVATPAPPRTGKRRGGATRARPAPRRAAGEELPSRVRLVRRTADHPVPLRASFAAGSAVLRLATHIGAADDVVYLASGGGSALLAAPLSPFVSAADKTRLQRVLLVSGAPIATINTVRKHLSAIKGGRLAVAARRARSQTTLVLCDVEPERYGIVASGPSLPDPTTLDDVVGAIDRYGLGPAMPARVLEALRAGRLPETPKPREAVFRRSRSMMILSNRDLRNAAVRAGLSRGLPAESMPSEVGGAVEQAVEMVARAIETAPPGTRLLVLGGEVRTAPAGPGRGGRAQEFALRLALRMAGLGSRPWAFLAMGSDGIDGNSPAAGAYVDATTIDRARKAGLDPARSLRDSDAHRFFHRLGDDFTTGPTGTNVRDLYLLLTGPVSAPRPGRGVFVRTSSLA